MATGTPETVSHIEHEADEGYNDSETSPRTDVVISVHYKRTVYHETKMARHAAVETDEGNTSWNIIGRCKTWLEKHFKSSNLWFWYQLRF